MRELEHPTPALVEELQHSAGNRAVTRLLQREPKTAPPPAAPPVDEVLDEYFQLLTDVASSNQKSVTGFRRDFMRDLEAELGGEYRAFAEAQDAGRQPAPAAVKRFQDRLLEYQNQWFFERHAGYEAWKELKTQYQDELRRLNEQGDFASLAAAKVLSSEYAETERRAGRLGIDLIAEDLSPLTYMMVRGKHIEIGGLRAQRMGESFEADLAEYEAEEAASLVNLAGDDSVLKAAWDVFGWDSVGEFAADVALTIITFGASKWLRTAAKADKLRRRAARDQGAAQAADGPPRRARQEEDLPRRRRPAPAARRRAQGVRRAAEVAEVELEQGRPQDPHRPDRLQGARRRPRHRQHGRAARGQGVRQRERDGALRQGRQVRATGAADGMGEAVQGQGRACQDALRRLLHAQRPAAAARQRDLLQGGRDRQARAPSGQTLRKVAVATVGECLQDLITAVPVFDLPVVKDGVESLRKYLVKEVEGLVQ